MIIRSEDTICAPATPIGGGAVSIIRVSGAKALECTDSVVKFRHGDAVTAKGNTIKFGTVEYDGQPLDDVLVNVFRAPHSYTGEDSAEICCHASAYIVSTLLQLLVAAGARMAEPGEFTRRAFLAGKLDLAQAEAVADLIAAGNASAHRVAMNQLRGGISKELASVRERLLEITSLVELELDFSEEEVEFADRKALKDLVSEALDRISRLIFSFKLGNAVKNGIPVPIVGAVNAGKSTLLNALFGEERAIVSEVAGTTRDTVEEVVNIAGTSFRFIDTAGIRQTDETVERLGIERSIAAMSRAEIVMGVVDCSLPAGTLVEHLRRIAANLPKGALFIPILNKTDLIQEDPLVGNKKVIYINNIVSCIDFEGEIAEPIYLSAKNGDGVQRIIEFLGDWASRQISSVSGPILTDARHFDELSKALESLTIVRNGLDTSLPTDLIAQDLREALYHLGAITGDISTDEILGKIFGKFCIGK